MKKAIAAALALLAATPAMAISRYNTPGMQCEAVREALRREGTAILRYPSARRPDLTLYDRYVRSNLECDFSEYADRAYVPTRDNPRCPVLQCKPKPDREDWPRIIPRNRL